VLVLACSIVAIGAIGFTLLVREQDVPPAPVENPELKDLETRRQVLYENLKDLQFEFHQGKLSDNDYQSLKSGFLYDLAGVMDSMERVQSKISAAEGPKASAEAAAKRKQKTSQPPSVAKPDRACPACHASNSPSNRFCGQCGAALT